MEMEMEMVMDHMGIHVDLTVAKYQCGARILRRMLPSPNHLKEYRHEMMISMLHHRKEEEVAVAVATAMATVLVVVTVVQIRMEEE